MEVPGGVWHGGVNGFSMEAGTVNSECLQWVRCRHVGVRGNGVDVQRRLDCRYEGAWHRRESIWHVICSEGFFKKIKKMWDTLILSKYLLIRKIHNFQGHLSDNLAKTATLVI